MGVRIPLPTTFLEAPQFFAANYQSVCNYAACPPASSHLCSALTAGIQGIAAILVQTSQSCIVGYGADDSTIADQRNSMPQADGVQVSCPAMLPEGMLMPQRMYSSSPLAQRRMWPLYFRFYMKSMKLKRFRYKASAGQTKIMHGLCIAS